MKPVLEKILLDKGRSISAFRYSKKNFERPWHFHPQHELTFIEDTVGTKFIGDFVGSYEPGELVLLRSNLPHCWKNHVPSKGKATSIVVHWNKGIFSKVPELDTLFSMLKTASRGIIFDKKEIEHFIPILKILPKISGDQLYVQLLSLLVGLSNCKQTTLSENCFRDDIPTVHTNRMAKIHNFVATQFHRKIYLKELAELLNMSEQSFSRFFSKMMGRPFFTFLNEYRINMASRLLVDTDKSVAEISYDCGYESLPFFHKQFNKFKGASPAKYRKKFNSSVIF